MMNELKPEDVMRALECWANGKPCQEECSILDHEEGASCLKLTARSALALLREKDAEIERLRGHLTQLKDRYDICKQNVTIARAEAITEFADRLKARNEKRDGLSFKVVSFDTIDQIAKEMKVKQ